MNRSTSSDGRSAISSPTAIVAVACSLLLLAMNLSCIEPADSANHPNVVIILIDTLRADHLSLYGYARPTSPNFERLAERGAAFDNFYAHSSATRPSVATLFTSRYVSRHGIVDQQGSALASSLPLLSELFDGAVYQRMAFVTNPQIHPLLGFDRGFDRFETFFGDGVDPRHLQPRDLVKTRAADVFEIVQEGLADLEGRPFFAYIHLLDPHGPYQPPDEDVRRFTDSGYVGSIEGSNADFVGIRHSGMTDGSDLEHFAGLYDAEIAATDRAIGHFVDWLETIGLLENTHLIITADHGEEFMEHGGIGHGFGLFEESVRIPLVWIGPGVMHGRRVPRFAGLVDIVPTLVDILGVRTSHRSFQGRSLRPLLEEDGEVVWPDVVFLEGPDRGVIKRKRGLFRAIARAVVTPDRKVLARGCTIGDDACNSLEVFDLARDPRELSSSRVDGQQATKTLDPDLSLYRNITAAAVGTDASAVAPQSDLPEAVKEHLRALGYTE